MTIPSNPPYLTDRSAIETDWLCGMKYWWNRLEGGIGIVPIKEADYFLQGREIHGDLAQLAEGRSLGEILEQIPKPDDGDQLKLESWTRRVGWVCAFAHYVWPQWIADHDIVMTEKELVYEAGPLWVGVIPDLILRTKCREKKLVYKEYKSAGRLNASWVLHWPYAIQTHLGIAAAQIELKEKIAYAHVLGMDKGYEKGGRLLHPYVWAYVGPNGEWGPYKYGWDHAPVWDYPEGVEAWVLKLGEEQASKLFASSAPIFLDQRKVDNLVKRRIVREQEIVAFKALSQTDPDIRLLHFEQRFTECRPVVGAPCPYISCCESLSVGKDPLASGLYTKRIPHHDLEIVGVERED